ncbi:unnamed protein product [Heterotrigona itama]|uniref:Uncharacterized protein n=1 Tax=Heterotrigona itama TaxID=395501 RepID=A0A6V7HCC0_9HYME|nr:unnamed protein product [Heterotrigona itama]
MVVKLPEMSLPNFDGASESWASFFDIFSSVIDQNEDLTPGQKLQYLRSTLRGRASCIEALPTKCKFDKCASKNSLLFTTILSKITPNTVWQWELTLKDKKMPIYTELLDFLEKQTAA